ncbi:MAG: immunity 22 family protein [Coprobacillus sp.]
MNNTEGYIAVWVGSFKDSSDFKEYIKVHYEYDDDIEDIDSDFEKDFGLKYYDRDIVESVILDKDYNTLKELFDGSSYLEDYIDKILDNQLYHYNVIIRVYDYKYEDETKSIENNGNSIMFYGNIEYEKVVDLRW